MIYVDDIEKLKELFGAIFVNAESYGFPDNVIQDKIIKSKFINDLEKGNLNFENIHFNKLIANILEIDIVHITSNFESRNYWIGELYVRLFFRYRKSFSYLFLYLPIKEAKNMFNLYHEMDFNQAYKRFEEIEKKSSILSLLIKQRKITMDALAIKSGINKNSIMKYCSSNKYIYGAGLDNIYQICSSLDVDIYLFIEHLNVFSNSMRFDFDKNNIGFRSLLGYYMVSTISPSIRSEKYYFDGKTFTTTNGELLLVANITDENLLNYQALKKERGISQSFKKENRKIIVFSDYDQITNMNYKQSLMKCFKEVYFVNKNLITDSNSKARSIDYLTYKNLINRAKERNIFDFALFKK